MVKKSQSPLFAPTPMSLVVQFSWNTVYLRPRKWQTDC